MSADRLVDHLFQRGDQWWFCREYDHGPLCRRCQHVPTEAAARLRELEAEVESAARDAYRVATLYENDEECATCGGTGYKPRPKGWDQKAHLNAPDRTCNCHDSWDQCPCADGGHYAGCDCCPGGTGLCGPLPCPECERSEIGDPDLVPVMLSRDTAEFAAAHWANSIGNHRDIALAARAALEANPGGVR